MRKQWFGDSRDYVKWSCVRAEAGSNLAVVYGPMLRMDNSRTGDKLDEGVVSFFDKYKDFRSIAELFPIGFELLQDLYSLQEADAYFARLAELVKARQSKSKVIVFLDPDTGVEPKSGPTNEHLRKKDIKEICRLLRSDEKFIVYQHASRSEGWQAVKALELERLAHEMEMELSEPYHEPNTAKDVCFFTFTKK